jgi:hypothetical protein
MAAYEANLRIVSPFSFGRIGHIRKGNRGPKGRESCRFDGTGAESAKALRRGQKIMPPGPETGLWLAFAMTAFFQIRSQNATHGRKFAGASCNRSGD